MTTTPTTRSVPPLNDWRISRALTSMRTLESVAKDMTLDEVRHALALEERAGRRRSLIDRLQRLVRAKLIQTEFPEEKHENR